MPNQSGTAISLLDSRDAHDGEGYVVAGASWAGLDNLWHDGAHHPTCIGTDTAAKDPRAVGHRQRDGRRGSDRRGTCVVVALPRLAGSRPRSAHRRVIRPGMIFVFRTSGCAVVKAALCRTRSANTKKLAGAWEISTGIDRFRYVKDIWSDRVIRPTAAAGASRPHLARSPDGAAGESEGVGGFEGASAVGDRT
jgi:hypothetical protein